VALFTCLLSSAAAEPQNAGRRIAGVWDSAVTITDCNGTILANFRGLGLFSPDGSLEQTNNMPPTLGKFGLGRWHYLGQQHYNAAFEFFRFDATGVYLGTQYVSRDIQMAPAGDSFTSAVTFISYDPNGVVVATGCGTETSTRVID
jgi:hypothetical protein